MITKERLEELIKQGSKVYCLEFNHIYSFDFEEYEGKIESATKCYPNDRLQIRWKKAPIGGIGPQWSEDIYLQDLFETEEDAEECLEFGNIIREEKLKIDIPFNDFCELDTLIEFTGKDGTLYLLYIFENKDIILWSRDGDTHTVFEKPLTKENYNEARRLCKKLFLGE